MADPVLQVTGFAHRPAGGGEVRVADFALQAGERLALTGPSGSGKSTLLLAIAGLLTPAAGSIRLAGEAWSQVPASARDRRRGRLIGFVPQDAHLAASLTVAQNLRLAQYLAGGRQDDARCREALAWLDIPHLATRRPHALSRGERQRAAIARAVVNRPLLILADEPTAALDDDATARVLELLDAAVERLGAALLVATHDARVRQHLPHGLAMAGQAA